MNIQASVARKDYWPALPAYNQWKDACDTLHLWLQVVGKIRLAQTPWINHSWHVPFYVTPTGLTTSPIPYGMRSFQIDFDFLDHVVRISTCEGQVRVLKLESRSVANFMNRIFALLKDLDLNIAINTVPNEMAFAIPFEEDHEHRLYDPDAVKRFCMALVQADRVLKQFRAHFRGKCSPVHFFWGSMDLAVTRFSGRPAPTHPGGVPHLPDWVVREAYSDEVSSCGFWPGDDRQPEPSFYSYAYPEPAGFARAPVFTPGASYSESLGEFVLPYSKVRLSPFPDETLLSFLQSTYEAAANAGNWDRTRLEFPDVKRTAA
jgi:hypothetical protein